MTGISAATAARRGRAGAIQATSLKLRPTRNSATEGARICGCSTLVRSHRRQGTPCSERYVAKYPPLSGRVRKVATG